MKVEEIKITVPKDMMDIRLGQFQEYNKLFETVVPGQDVNEFVKMKTVSIFCDVPFQLVREYFKASDVDALATEVLALVTLMTKSVESKTFNPLFTVNDTEFGFIVDFENMKAGEYADLTEYFGKWDEMHKAMAVMYRPVTIKKHNKILGIDQYDIQKYNGTNEYAEIMKGMPAMKALEASFFLTNLVLKLRICLQTYMAKQLKNNPEMDLALKKALLESGPGIKPSIQ